MVLVLWLGVFGVLTGAARPEVKVAVSSPAEIKIRVESLSRGREWSFRNAYAGVLGLAERVEQFRALGAGGTDLGVKKITTGEFRSNAGAETIEYVVKLVRPTAADVAHASWIAGESGFLVPADLLPQQLTDVLVEFSLPSGWTIHSTIEVDAQGRYRIPKPENAVFFVGRGLRTQAKTVGDVAIDAVIGGSWSFKDPVVLKAATKVLEKYRELTAFKLKGKSAVMIAPLPFASGSVKWLAETRGSTVVLLMDPRAKIKNWTGQLGIIFTHELLHLWVPNSLHLDGDYDWFFEGFTLYTALVTALDLKFINLKEYLATLQRVYDAYLSRPDDMSLIDASERRWTTGNSAVYNKGMLVAFLYDREIRRDSRGKMWLGGIYKQLFAHSATQPANGNDVIIRLLSASPAGAELAKNYIEGQKELDLKPVFADPLLKSLYNR